MEPSTLDRARPRGAEGLRMVPALCCLCGVEDAEPIGVGEDFEYRTSADSFLATRCRRCGHVYLNPRPAPEEMARIYPDGYHAFAFNEASFGFVHKVRRELEKRRVLKWCRGLPSDARILDIGCGDGFHLQLLKEGGEPGWSLEGVDNDPRAAGAAKARGITVHAGEAGGLGLPSGAYHLILLIMTIEHVDDPPRLMREVARLLAPGGKAVVVTDNAASWDARLFGGRHWGGYHFPRHFNLFDKAGLSRLAAAAGLNEADIKTGFSPVNWTYSVRNLLDDWGAPQWLVRRFTLKSPVALGFFTLLDLPLSLAGRGAILQATLARAPARSP